MVQSGTNSIGFNLGHLASILVDTTGISGRVTLNDVRAEFGAPTTFYLPDSTYHLLTPSFNGTYGTFVVQSKAITSATGALLITSSGIAFDLSKLASVTLDPTPLTTTAGVPGVTFVDLRVGDTHSPTTYRVPDGTYPILTPSFGGNYGTFTVLNAAVTATTGSLVFNAGTLTFETTKLAALTIDPSNLGESSAVQFVDMRVNDLHQPTAFFVPDGTYPILTPSFNGNFGAFTVSHQAVTGESGSITFSSGTIGFDLCKLNLLTVNPNAGVSWNISEARTKSVSGSGTVALPDGTYTLQTNSTFSTIVVAGGSVSPSSVPLASLSISPCITDNTAPSVTISSPSNAAYVRGVIPITASAIDTDPGDSIATMECFVGTHSLGVETGPAYSTSLDTSTLSDGSVSISCNATDHHGKTGTTTVAIVVDNTPPVVTIASPAAGATVSGTISLQASASDTNLSSLSCSINNQNVGAVTATGTSASLSASFNTLTLLDGALAITCSATDKAGNR